MQIPMLKTNYHNLPIDEINNRKDIPMKGLMLDLCFLEVGQMGAVRDRPSVYPKHWPPEGHVERLHAVNRFGSLCSLSIAPKWH